MKPAGLILLFLSVVLGSVGAACADQQAAKDASRIANAQKDTAGPQKELEEALKQHIHAGAKENDGLYALYDEDTDETFSVRTIKTLAESPMKVNHTTYIVRAQFLNPGDPEFGEKDLNILADFTFIKNKEKWELTEEVVYSVDGVVRYTYTKDFKRIRPSPKKGAEEKYIEESDGEENPDEKDMEDFDKEPQDI